MQRSVQGTTWKLKAYGEPSRDKVREVSGKDHLALVGHCKGFGFTLGESKPLEGFE